jgi:hypothetical protein
VRQRTKENPVTQPAPRSPRLLFLVVAGFSFPTVITASAGLALPAPAHAQPDAARPRPPAEPRTEPRPAEAAGRLPIKAITLYRSGVGSFERRGLVNDEEKVQLRFATEQINDILKSMVILDLDGGRIDGVSYGSKEPLQRRLSSFGVDISDDPSAARLLSRLRGAAVRVVTSQGPITGTVLGVETRPVPGGKDAAPIQTPFLNLVTQEGIRSFDLTTIGGFEILDKDLAAELGKALAALSEHRADRVKTVDVSFSGRGARQAVIAYVHEMPVWKTSYRLVLPDQPAGKAADPKAQPTIQGWAIVENTTDEDWEDVRLSLVAGRPVSFQMDLYEPLHVERPQIPVPTVPGVMPRMYQGGESFAKATELREMAAGRPPAAAPQAPQAARARRSRDEERYAAETGMPLEPDALTRYAAQSQAQAGEVGEVFEYALKAPVSIARQRSAMLPILASNIDGRRVSIFSRADSAEHPMRGVELKNSTGLQLMPGPISVYDGAAYAGDAQVGHITTGDTRLLAYAVDLDVQAITREDSRSEVRSLRIAAGLIQQLSKQQSRVSYAFSNKDAKRPRTLIVEHPKLAGWDLVEPKKPSEETAALYRFELTLDPSGKGTFDVVQEHTDVQGIGITSYDLSVLLAYARDGKVSPAVVDAVKKAADMQAAINQTQNRMGVLDQERALIEQDQGRIRQNMGTVSRDTDLYRRYMTKLNEQESRLEAIRDEREKLQATLTRQEGQLRDYLRDLNVE